MGQTAPSCADPTQLKAVENVMIPLLLNSVPRAKAMARAREALDRVALADRGSSLPSELSGGQQQRVAIARAGAWSGTDRLRRADERLDHETGQHVLEILRNIAVRDVRTLIIVTHDSRIFAFADRIAHMNDGRITRVERAQSAMGH